MPNATQTKPTAQPNPVITDAEYLNPQPRFGFTPFAELWNGRLAMIGFVAALLTEYFTGQGVLSFLGLM